MIYTGLYTTKQNRNTATVKFATRGKRAAPGGVLRPEMGRSVTIRAAAQLLFSSKNWAPLHPLDFHAHVGADFIHLFGMHAFI